jgi:hypothetical protein
MDIHLTVKSVRQGYTTSHTINVEVMREGVRFVGHFRAWRLARKAGVQ